MTSPLFLPDGSHWYYPDGSPAYEIERKDGKGLRAPTVRDARELNLKPSVTSMLSVLAKPGLEMWKQQQAVLSALTLPHNEGESLDLFAQRVVWDARSEGRRAADYGTHIHDLAEGWLSNRLPDTIDILDYGFLSTFMLWCEHNSVVPIEMEKSFAVDDYGGRVDFIGHINGNPAIVDWKTEKTTPKKAFTFYPEWNVQLSGYRDGLIMLDPKYEEFYKVSVAISSTEPGRIQAMTWFTDEHGVDWGSEIFHMAKYIYYSPLGPGYSLRKGVGA